MWRRVHIFVLVGFVGLVFLPVAAQDDIIASGLNSPRKLTYDADGTLYIAEAGTGGDTEAEHPVLGTVTIGLTGQISVVSPDGEQSVLIPDLLSMNLASGSVYGVDMIEVTDDSYWLVLGEGPLETPFDEPLVMVSTIAELDRETLEVKHLIDLFDYEERENPDGETISSDPIDLAFSDDGGLYIADAGGNSVLRWTEEDDLETFAAWPIEDNPVPTAVEIGLDGDIYVGFLSGFPFPAQGARIERWSADGELEHTYEGLTLVTDLLVTHDGTLYAVEMASGLGDTGFVPESGRVVEVSEDGLTPIAEDLNFPFGLAQDADGNLAVSINAAFGEPGTGEVIRISP